MARRFRFDPHTLDPGPDGKSQTVLEGCERISLAEVAKRRAKDQLRPSAAQEPCDVGLFSDGALQIDLCDLLTLVPPPPDSLD